MNIYLSIKQKTWSNLSSLISHNLDQVLIPSQNTWLSSCMVTWLSHDKTLPPRHGWLHPSSRLLAWFDFVPGDLIRGQVVPLVMTVVGGERRSAYSWRASLSALHTLGEGEVVQSTRLGYSWRTSFQTGFSTTKHKAKQINIVSSLFVVVKCSQVYWISQYNQKFTSLSTSYMTCTCIYRCICTNEKATFLTRELPKNRWTHNWLPLKHWPPCDIWHMIPQFRLLWYIIGIFLYLKTWYFKIAIKFWFSWLKKKIISIHTIHKHFLRCWVNKGLSRFFYGQRSLIFNIDLVTSNSIEVITLLKAQSNGS